MRPKRGGRAFGLALLVFPAFTAGAAEEAPGLAIRAGKILTVTQGVINHGVILVRDGKIEALGRDVAIPAGYQVIDASDRWVFPGFVDIHSHIGVDLDINDMVEPLNPELRVFDQLNPRTPAVADALANGITTLNVVPGSGTNHSGYGVLFKTAGETPEEMIIRPFGVMKIAQGFNPERPGGDLGRGSMGMAWMIRDLLQRGQAYAEAWAAYERGETKEAPELKPELELLRGVFEDKYPVLVHTYAAWGTMETMRIFHDEFGLKAIPTHVAFGGYLIGEEAAARQQPINIGPHLIDFWWPPEKRFQGIATGFHDAGVKNLSLNTDTVGDWGMSQEELILQGAMAVRFGLPEDAALRAVTINPAKAVDIDDRVGSLEVGKDADLVIKAGGPFDLTAPVEMVLVNGRVAYDWKHPRPGVLSHYQPGAERD